MSDHAAECNCDEARALKARVAELEALVPLMQARIDAMSVFDDQDDEEIRENLEAWKESGASAERAAIVKWLKRGGPLSPGWAQAMGIESLAHHHAAGEESP